MKRLALAAIAVAVIVPVLAKSYFAPTCTEQISHLLTQALPKDRYYYVATRPDYFQNRVKAIDELTQIGINDSCSSHPEKHPLKTYDGDVTRQSLESLMTILVNLNVIEGINEWCAGTCVPEHPGKVRDPNRDQLNEMVSEAIDVVISHDFVQSNDPALAADHYNTVFGGLDVLSRCVNVSIPSKIYRKIFNTLRDLMNGQPSKELRSGIISSAQLERVITTIQKGRTVKGSRSEVYKGF